MNYTLTYARLVILTTTVEADSASNAYAVARKKNNNGELGLTNWEAKEGSWVDDIQDYPSIWEIDSE